MPTDHLLPDLMPEAALDAAMSAVVWLHRHREDVCPDPYDPQDFIGVESLRPTLSEPPTPKHQPWQDWADVFPRYSDGHDGPGGVVTWKRARAADTEGGEA